MSIRCKLDSYLVQLRGLGNRLHLHYLQLGLQPEWHLLLYMFTIRVLLERRLLFDLCGLYFLHHGGQQRMCITSYLSEHLLHRSQWKRLLRFRTSLLCRSMHCLF